MGDITGQVQQWLKRAAAVVLFSLLLIGSTGAVFSALAAGVTALSDMHPRWEIQTVGSTSAQAQTAMAQSHGGGAATNPYTGQSAHQNASQAANQNTNPPVSPRTTLSGANGASAGSSYTSSPSTTAPTGTVPQTKALSQPSLGEQLNQQLRHMHSPVMERLDAGGVALGDQVQNTFGHMLAGLLQTMFLEQSDGSASNVGSVGSGQ